MMDTLRARKGIEYNIPVDYLSIVSQILFGIEHVGKTQL